MSKFKYISLWMDSMTGLLNRVNCYNLEPKVPGRVYELQQILPQSTAGDTPGGHVTEGWIGIVKVTTPDVAAPEVSLDSTPDPNYLCDPKGEVDHGSC